MRVVICVFWDVLVWFVLRESAEWVSWRLTSSSHREVREIHRAHVSLSDFH